METMFESLLNTDSFFALLSFEGPAYLLTVLVVFVIAKLVFDLFTPYKLGEQLTKADNKAVALSFAGYMLGVGIIMLGVYNTDTLVAEGTSPRIAFYWALGDSVLWGIIGILLLQAARVCTNKILLPQFDTVKELVEDKNVGTGAVMFGNYIGSALIVHAAVMGESSGLLIGLIETLIYFVVGQLGFIIFAAIYQAMTRYDLHAEIEKDNISAGVAFGMSMIAVAILLSSYLVRFDSLPGFGLWFVFSLFFLAVIRFIVDKWLLPGDLLDEEIMHDQNWGAALVEGAVAIGIAILLGPVFLG